MPCQHGVESCHVSMELSHAMFSVGSRCAVHSGVATLVGAVPSWCSRCVQQHCAACGSKWSEAGDAADGWYLWWCSQALLEGPLLVCYIRPAKKPVWRLAGPRGQPPNFPQCLACMDQWMTTRLHTWQLVSCGPMIATGMQSA
jgi:hypothetical protein